MAQTRPSSAQATAHWNRLRQLVLFGLGVAIIIYELVTPDARVALDVTGLVLVGLVPVDMALSAWSARPPPSGGREG